MIGEQLKREKDGKVVERRDHKEKHITMFLLKRGSILF